MDQNQKKYDQSNAATIRKLHDSNSRSIQAQGSGSKHYAIVRPGAYRNAYSNARTRLNSPRRILPDDHNRHTGKQFGDAPINSTWRAASSFTKQLFDQSSKTLNARTLKRQAQANLPIQTNLRHAITECSTNSCSLTDERKAVLRNPASDGKAICARSQLVAKEDIAGVRPTSAKRPPKSEAASKNRAHTIIDISHLAASLPESRPPIPNDISKAGQEIHGCNQESKLEENVISSEENLEPSHQTYLNAVHQQQQQRTSMQSTSAATFGNLYSDVPTHFNLANLGFHVGNCFSCSNVHHSVPTNISSQLQGNLRRQCTSVDQFHSPFSLHPPQQGSGGLPDITIHNTGKCAINTFCQAADAVGLYFNVHGFEVAFYQSTTSTVNPQRSVRVDFSTLGFLDPDSLETEVDDKGNIFVFGNIFSTTSQLWISVPHCPNPDSVFVAHPAPYLFTIEIPCE